MKPLFLFILLTCFCVLNTKAQIITTFAGDGTNSMGRTVDDGQPAASVAVSAGGMCTDALGNVYISDWGHSTIRKVDNNGIITTIAGTGVRGYSGDGTPATSAQLTPGSIAIDDAGNFYFADYFRLRKITAATGLISTIAGNGIKGYSKDTTIAVNVSLGDILGLKVAPDGNVYFVDYLHSDSTRVRRVSPAGTLTTVAGRLNNPTLDPLNGEGGQAVNAFLLLGGGLAIDKTGNLYLGTSTTVKKVMPDGTIHTIAGDGVYGYNGEGLATSIHISDPQSIAIDGRGNLFISEQGENRVRVVYPNGQTRTHVNNMGNARTLFSGDGGLSQNAGMYLAYYMCVDLNDNLFFADLGSYRIRKVTSIPGLGVGAEYKKKACLYPNPTENNASIKFAELFTGNMDIYSANGQLLFHTALISSSKYNISTTAFPAGNYFIHLVANDGDTQSLTFMKQ